MAYRVKVGCNIPDPNPSEDERKRIAAQRAAGNRSARAEVRLEVGAIVEPSEIPKEIFESLLKNDALEPLIVNVETHDDPAPAHEDVDVEPHEG